jgi:hypothetical protein
MVPVVVSTALSTNSSAPSVRTRPEELSATLTEARRAAIAARISSKASSGTAKATAMGASWLMVTRG